MVGPLPKSFIGYQYILADTNYFSKWAETTAYREVKKETVAIFIRTNIIYHYGVPRCIITDNGKQFDMSKLCAQLNFKQHHSSAYHALVNGLIEVSIRHCVISSRRLPTARRKISLRKLRKLYGLTAQPFTHLHKPIYIRLFMV